LRCEETVKIGRFAHGGLEFWAVVDPEAGTATDVMAPLESWAVGASRGERPSGAEPGRTFALDDVTVLPPLEPGARIFGVGLNYSTHLGDSGAQIPVPDEMPGFLMLAESLIADGDEMRHPPSEKLDFEIEIVAILATALPRDGDATQAVLGYTLGNDMSVRDAPVPGGMVDLYAMKAQDATTPVGPWIVTTDAVGGPGQPSIDFELLVNDEVRQRDNTRNMLWSMDRILRFIDGRSRLRAGDMIFTGTPGGTGMRDQRFLAPGDVVELRAGGFGTLRNRVGRKEHQVGDPT
jgi:2-keto-4-pentenoate hydratase/2-oxohepta-3-ene-1,7-dioic acid hydratase in catechol pathway